MITWKEVYLQEEMRKVRMAEAQNARMVKIATAKAEDGKSAKKDKIYLLKLFLATKLVEWGDALRARGSEMSLAGER